MRREVNAALLNELANLPGVYKLIANTPDSKPIDCTSLVQSPDNFLLVDDSNDGAVLFTCLDAGLYAAYPVFKPEFFGPRGDQFLAQAIHWMFTRSPCIEVWLKHHSQATPIADMAKRLGFQVDSVCAESWHGFEGGMLATHLWSMPYSVWVVLATGLAELVSDFFVMLGKERPTDLAYARRLGATLEMILSGQVDKGAILFNRWAMFAGYAAIGVVGRVPIVVTLGKTIITVDRGEFTLLT